MTACGWSVVTAVAIALQPATHPPQARQPDPAAVSSLEKIREGLAQPPGLVIPDVTDRVRFRLTVEGLRPLLVNPPWDPSDVVPDYVRTTRPLYHHEFLQMVTPEAFRSGTLYPGVSVSAIAQALVGGIREEIRQERQEAIRRQVKEELRLFLEEQRRLQEQKKNEQKKNDPGSSPTSSAGTSARSTPRSPCSRAASSGRAGNRGSRPG